jgi:hypothetical protein
MIDTANPTDQQTETAKCITRHLFAWLQQVAADRALPNTAAGVAIAIGKFINRKSGEAWPTQETLANVLGITVRAVQRNLAALADRGHLSITVARGRHKPNTYRTILINTTRATQKHDARDTETRHVRRTEPLNEPKKEPLKEDIYPELFESSDVEQANTSKNTTSTRTTSTRTKIPPDDFDEFWLFYPLKKAKGAAEVAFRRALSKAPAAAVLAGAQRYAAEAATDPGRWLKHPATWLNARCWEDEPTASPARTRGTMSQIEEALAIVDARVLQ